MGVVADVRAKKDAGTEINMIIGDGKEVDLDTVEARSEAYVKRYQGALADDGIVCSWLPLMQEFGGAPHLLMFYSFQTDWSYVMALTATESQRTSLRLFKSIGPATPP